MPGTMYLHDDNVLALVEQIKQLPRADNDVVLLLIAEPTPVDIQALWVALRQQEISIAGGVFPGVIYGNQKHESGIVASVLPQIAAPTVVTGLDSPNLRLGNLPTLPREHQYTALVFVDGLTKHVAFFLDRLFGRMGNRVRYIGGGAGSLSFQQKPCLFDNFGIYQDAALVLWLKTTTSLGVRHGWHSLRGPFIATETDGTRVKKLDNQPAFEFYKQIIEMQLGKTLTQDNFFQIAKEHPLGIFHPSMDYIVRDPITFTDDGSLVCVGEVPARSMIYILRGDRQSLVDNARMATNDALKQTPAGQHNFIVDCISRVLYLEDDFERELDAVLSTLPADASTPFGVLSLGEIATFMTGRVEFFNKTMVVGSLKDAS